MVAYTKILTNVKDILDFTEPSGTLYDDLNDTLIINTNPIENWKLDPNFTLDEAIINEYTNDIFNGALDNLLKLIVWSIKSSESKKNKFLIVMPSETGKTTLFRDLLHFTELGNADFKKGLKGVKVSKEFSERLKQSGLLYVDDIMDLPLEIRNVSDTINFDIMNVGSIPHPCKVLTMTTTHNALVDEMFDELRNRVLVFDIKSKKTFNDSELCRDDINKYKLHTSYYIKLKIKELFDNDVDKIEFEALKEKYSIEKNNLVEELQEELEQRVVKLLKEKIEDVNDGYRVVEANTDKDSKAFKYINHIEVKGKSKVMNVINQALREMKEELGDEPFKDKSKIVNTLRAKLFEYNEDGSIVERKMQGVRYYITAVNFTDIVEENEENLDFLE